jgi:hypothetical protein
MRDTLSKLAEGSYAMGKKNAKVVDKVAAANEKAHGTDYVVIPKHSNADITTYHHKDNPKNIVIAHRGTVQMLEAAMGSGIFRTIWRLPLASAVTKAVLNAVKIEPKRSSNPSIKNTAALTNCT